MKKILAFLIALLPFSLQADTAFQRFNPVQTYACGIPIGLAASGTMADDGAVVLGTPLGLTYSNGIWLHFPADAIESGSAAGFYWTVMTNTTAGTVYNSTYTPGTSAFCQSGTTTAFNTTGPGAFTASTSATNLAYVTIPAGSMGPNGWLEIVTQASNTSSGTNKSWSLRFGGASGTQYLNNSVTTTPNFTDLHFVRNRGLVNAQVGTQQSIGALGLVTAVPIVGAIATSTNNDVVWQGTKVAATDNMVLEGISVKVFFGP